MSKSLGNYIGVSEAPAEMYGKAMSIPDEVLWDWFTMVTDVPEPEIAEMRTACGRGEMNPREAKARLAREIVGRLPFGHHHRRGGGTFRSDRPE